MKSLALILLVGCAGIPDEHSNGEHPDGGAVVSSDGAGEQGSQQTICGGRALPATAPSQLSIRGSVMVSDVYTVTGGSTIELWRSGDASPMASAVTSSGGTFLLSPLTHQAPIAGFLRGTRSGYHDGYYYPSAPFATNDDDAHTTVWADADLARQYANGMPTPSRGVVWVNMEECDGSSLAGATIAVSPATTGQIRYIDRSYNPHATPDSSTVAAEFDAPAGPVTVTATQGTRALRTSHIELHADAVTVIDVLPQ